MKRKLHIHIIFYKSFTVYNLLFTAIGAATLYQWGAYAIPAVFWIKILGFVGLVGMFHLSRAHQYYFYYNLGMSKAHLLTVAWLLDWIISLGILIPVYG